MSNKIAGTYEVTPAAGYAGDVSPNTAWKILSENKDAVLIDVRTRAEWNYVGLPDLATLGGKPALRQAQTITREQALIAHTRDNAYFVFREGDLGSLQPGKYADLLVLNRDYLKVPAGEIKDLKPLMTMVGGKVVYQAN